MGENASLSSWYFQNGRQRQQLTITTRPFFEKRNKCRLGAIRKCAIHRPFPFGVSLLKCSGVLFDQKFDREYWTS